MATWWKKRPSSSRMTAKMRRKKSGTRETMRRTIRRCLSPRARSQRRRRNDLVLYATVGSLTLNFLPTVQTNYSIAYPNIIMFIDINCSPLQSTDSSSHPRFPPSTSCPPPRSHCSSNESKLSQSRSKQSSA